MQAAIIDTVPIVGLKTVMLHKSGAKIYQTGIIDIYFYM